MALTITVAGAFAVAGSVAVIKTQHNAAEIERNVDTDKVGNYIRLNQ